MNRRVAVTKKFRAFGVFKRVVVHVQSIAFETKAVLRAESLLP